MLLYLLLVEDGFDLPDQIQGTHAEQHAVLPLFHGQFQCVPHIIDDGDAETFGLGFTTNCTEVMPEFRVYEPHAYGFITIPFWNADFSTANYCMLRTVFKNSSIPAALCAPSRTTPGRTVSILPLQRVFAIPCKTV